MTPEGRTHLEKEFAEDMRDIYDLAKKHCNGYRATRFLQTINRHGALKAAELLAGSDGISDGLTRLFMEGHLELSLEALILKEKYHSLFSEELRGKCRLKLDQFHFVPEN